MNGDRIVKRGCASLYPHIGIVSRDEYDNAARKRVARSMKFTLAILPEYKEPIPPLRPGQIDFCAPTVISVPDYSKGFGHTDLITC